MCETQTKLTDTISFSVDYALNANDLHNVNQTIPLLLSQLMYSCEPREMKNVYSIKEHIYFPKSLFLL